MKNARIVVFEDKPAERDKIRMVVDLFSDNDHSIVAEADSLVGAYGYINQIRTGDLLADVVVLDGNLSPGDTSGNDAAQLMHHIRTNNLGIYVVGNSAVAMSEYGIIVDQDAQKNAFRLVEILDQLPERS